MEGPLTVDFLGGRLQPSIFQIAGGYADQNDADTVRRDPLVKLVCGRLPETDPDLANQLSLFRFENAFSNWAERRSPAMRVARPGPVFRPIRASPAQTLDESAIPTRMMMKQRGPLLARGKRGR